MCSTHQSRHINKEILDETRSRSDCRAACWEYVTSQPRQAVIGLNTDSKPAPMGNHDELSSRPPRAYHIGGRSGRDTMCWIVNPIHGLPSGNRRGGRRRVRPRIVAVHHSNPKGGEVQLKLLARLGGVRSVIGRSSDFEGRLLGVLCRDRWVSWEVKGRATRELTRSAFLRIGRYTAPGDGPDSSCSTSGEGRGCLLPSCRRRCRFERQAVAGGFRALDGRSRPVPRTCTHGQGVL